MHFFGYVIRAFCSLIHDLYVLTEMEPSHSSIIPLPPRVYTPKSSCCSQAFSDRSNGYHYYFFFYYFRKRYNVEVFKKIASKQYFFFMLEFARNFDVNEMEP